MTMNRYSLGQYGKSAYERLKGKKLIRDVAEFGENVWYHRPGITCKDKLDVRWESGIWLGVRDESGEVVIGTEKGVLKTRSFRRTPPVER